MKDNLTLSDLIKINRNFNLLESVKFDGVQYAERVETTEGAYVVVAYPCISKKQLKEIGCKALEDSYANFKIALVNFVDLIVGQYKENETSMKVGLSANEVAIDEKTIVSQFRYILKILGFDKSEISKIMFIDENGNPRNNKEVTNYLLTSVLPLFVSADMIGKKVVFSYAQSWNENKGYFIPAKNIALFESWIGAKLNEERVKFYNSSSIKIEKKYVNSKVKEEKATAREMELHRILVQLNAVEVAENVEVAEKKTKKTTKKTTAKTVEVK